MSAKLVRTSACFGHQASKLSGLITVLSRVRSQRSFDSDCTPKHLFVDPAPACEETPDLIGRHVNIRYSTALRDMARLNQTCVVRLNTWIDCPTQTEPSPQESLLQQQLIQSFLRKWLYFILMFSASCLFDCPSKIVSALSLGAKW